MARFDKAIPPGGEGRIILKVNTKGFKGSITKTARVYTNDPVNKVAVIRVSATVRVSIFVSPESVYLRGVVGDRIKGLVDIKAQDPAPLLLKPVGFSLADMVEYRINILEKGRHYQIIFANKCTEERQYRGFLRLQTSYPDKPEITIRIRGNIRPQGQWHSVEKQYPRTGDITLTDPI